MFASLDRFLRSFKGGTRLPSVEETELHFPALQALAKELASLLAGGRDAAIIGPPGCGTSEVTCRAVEILRRKGVAVHVLDCADGPATAGLPAGLPRLQVLIVENLGRLPLADQLSLVPRINAARATKLWVGCVDTRAFRAQSPEATFPATDAHRSYPALARDELLFLYRKKVSAKGSTWGEAIYYLAYDWCGGDLKLFDSFAQEFYGDWKSNIHDDAVRERLESWINGSAVNQYRGRRPVDGSDSRRLLDQLLSGVKVVARRPEPNLETSDAVRRLVLEGFLRADSVLGYHAIRNLAAAFVAAEGAALAVPPIEMFRPESNARVNNLLQDVELNLRASLRGVIRGMAAGEWRKKLQDRRSERRLFEKELPVNLVAWAKGTPGGEAVADGLRKEMNRLEKNFQAHNSTWSEVQRRYEKSTRRLDQVPDLVSVDYLTFNELSELVRELDALYVPARGGAQQEELLRKHCEAYLALVNRLRNNAAHLRNIGFQDMQELVTDTDKIRQHQVKFARP